MIKAKVKQIETMGLLDGPGIRIVIFLQGCPLRCLFCHNPEMWDYKEVTPEYTPQELLKIILNYEPYFGDNGGVTFSGGEPLMHSLFLREMVKLCHQYHINVALDTAGSVYNKNVELLIDDIDLVLLDIKGINDKNYEYITKRTMTNFNKFLSLLKRKNKKLWLRIVIVPGINDNLEYIKRLASYIKNIPNVERVELLPFHKLGDSKYEQLEIINPLKDTKAMDINKCKKLEDQLQLLLKKRD